MRIYIDEHSNGMSVKQYLYGTLGYSSALVKKLKFNPGGIRVNGEDVTVRYTLKAGDVLELTYEGSSENIVPTDMPLSVIYEDEYMIALDKPHGMPTHPSHNHYTDTLANAVMYYFTQKGLPFVFRAVNRLDADTSGIVLVAKEPHAAHLLADTMQAGGFAKKYIALLHGKLTHNSVIDLPIMRSADSTMLRCVDTACTTRSKRAITSYEIISAGDDRTLVCASPITGRTHQLRVHFSHIGHPIYGDGLYGASTDGSDYPRLALHCSSLSFKHPITHEHITLTSPTPNDISL